MRRPVSAVQLVAEARGRSVDLVPLAIDPGRSVTHLDPHTRSVTRLFDIDAADAAHREAEALTLAHACGVPVPELRDQFEARGRIGLVLGHVPGAPLALIEPDLGPAEHRALMRQIGAFLARLHAVDGPFDPRPAPVAVSARAERAGNALAIDTSLPSALRDALQRRVDALVRLSRRIPKVVPVLCHGSVDARHVLIQRRPGRSVVTALVDFADAGPDDPMSDLAAVVLDGLLTRHSRCGVLEGYLDGHELTAKQLVRIEVHLVDRLAARLSTDHHPAVVARLAGAASAVVDDEVLALVAPARRGIRLAPRRWVAHAG